MNSTGRILAVTALALGMAGAAAAATMSFEEVLNFSGTGTHAGRDYVEVDDRDGHAFSYLHSVTFDPAAEKILSAELVLSHTKNSGGGAEFWLLSSDGGASIGSLAPSNEGWVDQVFLLGESFFSSFAGANWSLALKLTEATNGADKLWLDGSSLRGTYVGTEVGPGLLSAGRGTAAAAVPEPRSMILLGSGLLVLAAVLRRRTQPA